MTTDTLSAKLNALLDPLNALQDDLQAALQLALAMRLSSPYIATIKGTITRLDAAFDEINEIATALDPHRAKDQL